ncbi:hypothetical protein [Paenibacillus sp. 1011MAR3C5]|nr:hypothetical protein [Paenibacillus sp. 1011MAR3C5]
MTDLQTLNRLVGTWHISGGAEGMFLSFKSRKMASLVLKFWQDCLDES